MGQRDAGLRVSLLRESVPMIYPLRGSYLVSYSLQSSPDEWEHVGHPDHPGMLPAHLCVPVLEGTVVSHRHGITEHHAALGYRMFGAVVIRQSMPW